MKEMKDIDVSLEGRTLSLRKYYPKSPDFHTADTLETDMTPLRQSLVTSPLDADDTLPFSDRIGEAALTNPQRDAENTATQLMTAETKILSTPETRTDPNHHTIANLRTATPSSHLYEGAGKYEYLGEIARGGMGRVISVQDRSLRRRVAMKLLIAPKGESTTHQVSRLLAEAQTTGQLEHPNIVPIHDVGIHQGDNYYFTMKLVKGTTLKDVFRKLAKHDAQTRERYSLARLLGIFQQIANGLGFAHSRGVIHRDLKPDNIMIGEFGEVLIMDWGIAKLVQPTGNTGATSSVSSEPSIPSAFQGIDTAAKEGTAVGTVAGTLGYMSPEQARGEVDRLDARTDIFSLGAMLYELLAGSPPYNHPTSSERLLAAANEEAIERPAIRLRRTKARQVEQIPREVAAIAMKAISLKPEDRYQSAQDFFNDIQRYLEGHSVTACPDTLVQRATKWTKRNRVLVRTVVALVLAVVLAGWGARYLIRRSVISSNNAQAQKILAAATAEREKRLQQVPQANATEDAYADLKRQRELDSIDEKYSEQLTQAANYYSRIFDYDPANADARRDLANVYMEMWRASQRRNKPELMAAYAQEVARYAGPESYQRDYQAEINGDGKFALASGQVKADVFIFRNVETGKWNRLTPVPYRFRERKVDEEAQAEATTKLLTAADGRDGSSIYSFNLDSKYGHHLGQTPLNLEQMPVGSYVLVLRVPGYEELHLPVTLARQKNLKLDVRLLKRGDRPQGFSYIPSVFAKVGGPAAGSKQANHEWKLLRPFFIQTHEVTFGEYEQFLKDLMAAGLVSEARKHLPRDFGFLYLDISGSTLKPHASLTEGWRKWPVRGVSWLDAQRYAQWRSSKDGVTYRLPSELEWEVAARGTDGRRYTWGEVFWPQAARLSQGYTSANNAGNTGKSADESVFGVWDLTGSQAEWCADEFGGRAGERVLRGNAWALQPVGLETAFRTSGPPDYFHSTTGFRLATDVR